MDKFFRSALWGSLFTWNFWTLAKSRSFHWMLFAIVLVLVLAFASRPIELLMLYIQSEKRIENEVQERAEALAEKGNAWLKAEWERMKSEAEDYRSKIAKAEQATKTREAELQAWDLRLRGQESNLRGQEHELQRQERELREQKSALSALAKTFPSFEEAQRVPAVGMTQDEILLRLGPPRWENFSHSYCDHDWWDYQNASDNSYNEGLAVCFQGTRNEPVVRYVEGSPRAWSSYILSKE